MGIKCENALQLCMRENTLINNVDFYSGYLNVAHQVYEKRHVQILLEDNGLENISKLACVFYGGSLCMEIEL